MFFIQRNIFILSVFESAIWNMFVLQNNKGNIIILKIKIKKKKRSNFDAKTLLHGIKHTKKKYRFNVGAFGDNWRFFIFFSHLPIFGQCLETCSHKCQQFYLSLKFSTSMRKKRNERIKVAVQVCFFLFYSSSPHKLWFCEPFIRSSSHYIYILRELQFYYVHTVWLRHCVSAAVAIVEINVVLKCIHCSSVLHIRFQLIVAKKLRNHQLPSFIGSGIYEAKKIFFWDCSPKVPSSFAA